MTAETIAVIVGALVSILLEVVPGLKDGWTTWRWKPLTLLVGFIAVPVVAWALACFAGINFIPTPDNCGAEGLLRAIVLGFVTFMANQTAFAVAVRKTANVQEREGVQ